MGFFDYATAAAHRATRLPDGWIALISMAVGEWPDVQGVMLKGAVCPPRQRGPRKGSPDWKRRDRSTEREVFVSNDQLAEAKRALEADPLHPAPGSALTIGGGR